MALSVALLHAGAMSNQFKPLRPILPVEVFEKMDNLGILIHAT
jgi:hypothetical protein